MNHIAAALPSQFHCLYEAHLDASKIAGLSVQGARWLYFKQEAVFCFNNRSFPQEPLFPLNGSAVFIGRFANGEAVFAALAPQTASDKGFTSARQLRAVLTQAENTAISRAMQLLRLPQKAAFCPLCGARADLDSKEPAMACPQCKTKNYPTLNPAVLVLVEKDDSILLAHNASFPAGLYSLLAGFNEAGESLEDTVARETYEEAGIYVKNIVYKASQSWAYPHSLMAGFACQWDSGSLKADLIEITDARWTKAGHLPQLPARGALARKLIDNWLQKEA